jgi:hypothetical protein
VVEHHGPLSVRDALGWIDRTAKAVLQMHGRGQVHGCLCTDAILVSGGECEGEGRLLHPADVTQPDAFRAPGRGSRADPNARDDVWALCVSLYFCTTGRLPFPAGVDRWRAEGRRDLPCMAVHGSDLAVLQLLMDPLLLPAVGDVPIPTIIELRSQLERYAPSSSRLEGLPLSPKRPPVSQHPPRRTSSERPARGPIASPAGEAAPAARAAARAPEVRSPLALPSPETDLEGLIQGLAEAMEEWDEQEPAAIADAFITAAIADVDPKRNDRPRSVGGTLIGRRGPDDDPGGARCVPGAATVAAGSSAPSPATTPATPPAAVPPDPPFETDDELDREPDAEPANMPAELPLETDERPDDEPDDEAADAADSEPAAPRASEPAELLSLVEPALAAGDYQQVVGLLGPREHARTLPPALKLIFAAACKEAGGDPRPDDTNRLAIEATAALFGVEGDSRTALMFAKRVLRTNPVALTQRRAPPAAGRIALVVLFLGLGIVAGWLLGPAAVPLKEIIDAVTR